MVLTISAIPYLLFRSRVVPCHNLYASSRSVHGKVLRKRNKLKSPCQPSAFTCFGIVMNITETVVASVSHSLINMAAATWLSIASATPMYKPTTSPKLPPSRLSSISMPLSYPRPVSALRRKRVFSTKAQVQVQEAVQGGKQNEIERRLYVGNIPRTCNNEELAKMFGECGTVEKAEVMYDKYTKRSRRFAFVTMSTVEDAQAAIEKINGTEIGGRVIKVNITEKPLDVSGLNRLTEEAEFIDSQYKVYVGNLAKTVTTETLKKKFAEKGNVLDAKVTRIPETGKSGGYGFVSFSSEADVEAAVSAFNNVVLEGKPMRVNVA